MFAFLLNPGGKRRKRKSRSCHYVKRKGARRYKRCYGRRKSFKGGRRSAKARRRYRRARRSGYRTLSYRKKHGLGEFAKGGFWHSASVSARDNDKLPTAAERGYRSVANNGRRRRRNGRRVRARNANWFPAMAMNPGGSAYAMNPNPLKSVFKGYRFGTMMDTVPLAAGLLGNMVVSGFLMPYLPTMLSTGIGSYFLQLGTAGLTGAVVGMLAPKYAGGVLIGGVTGVMINVVRNYVLPMFSHTTAAMKGMLGSLGLGCLTGNCGGMGAYNVDYAAGNWGGGMDPDQMAASNPFTLAADFTQAITPEDMTPQLEYSRPMGGFSADTIDNTATVELTDIP